MSAAGKQTCDDQAEPAWVGEVLHYWFDAVGPAHWFNLNREVDAQIRERFFALQRQIATGQLSGFSTARAMLAAVIVLDQFSRNIFRGTPDAYAVDPLARQLADTAISRGYDLEMTIPQRQFLYLPFQHSEDRADQTRSVVLFEKLGNKAWLEYALAHQSIIDRFGRFPHRNEILGRSSSATEIASMNEPMGAF
jgi:uncharacterized protein (DUF924 family)